MELTLRRGPLEVKCSINGNILDLILYRENRIGLRIHEKLRKIPEDLEELRSRPRWLGDESDSLIRECLLALKGRLENEKGRSD